MQVCSHCGIIILYNFMNNVQLRLFQTIYHLELMYTFSMDFYVWQTILTYIPERQNKILQSLKTGQNP